jgi:hypothetical protein
LAASSTRSSGPACGKRGSDDAADNEKNIRLRKGGQRLQDLLLPRLQNDGFFLRDWRAPGGDWVRYFCKICTGIDARIFIEMISWSRRHESVESVRKRSGFVQIRE